LDLSSRCRSWHYMRTPYLVSFREVDLYALFYRPSVLSILFCWTHIRRHSYWSWSSFGAHATFSAIEFNYCKYLSVQSYEIVVHHVAYE
jgi:hypothetical protein